MTPRAPVPPVAAERPVTTRLHGIERHDPYAWLRDPDWQRVMREPERLSPDIRAYLEAENAYTESVLAPFAGLRKALYEEMRARIKEDDSSVPSPDGAWEYYARYVEGGEHPVYCRAPRGGGAEQVLLDGDREADGTSYFRIGACRHAPDHRRIAYSLDLNGSERFRIFVRDIATGETLGAPLPDGRGDVAWANDGETLFYTVIDENHRPHRVRRHRIGEDPEADAVVYDEPDSGFYVGIGKSESGRFVVISTHDHQTSEVRLIDADAPDAEPILVAAREPGVEYDVTHHGETLYILTNADGAVDFKVVTAPLADPGRAHWRDWLAHRPGVYLRGLVAFRDFLVRLERVEALPRIVVTRLADRAEHEIVFAEEAYDLTLQPGFEFATATLRFTYGSMTTPLETFDYDMASRARALRKTQEIPSGHDPAEYVTRRLHATSRDGKRVPISLFHRRTTPLDGTAPLLLYGYGAYGISIPASFATNRLSLADRGFVYAIAHIRGGTECGYGWYLDGKAERKTNTFEDFIAAAEHLVAEGYTSPGRIAAQGGSAGGMLMGAVANMRPDLFGAIVADVPFVDVLNTMCDASLPLTPPEWTEWGNPIEDAAAFQRIMAYSPYDNVGRHDYPAMIISAGLTDPRVTYWEPAKWVARLRKLKTDARPILLHTNMEAGHGGAAGRFDRLEEVARVYAFLLMMFGLADG